MPKSDWIAAELNEVSELWNRRFVHKTEKVSVLTPPLLSLSLSLAHFTNYGWVFNKIPVCWDVRLCRWASGYGRFVGSQCVRLQGLWVQDEGTEGCRNPTRERHIPEDLYLQKHRCDNLKSWEYCVSVFGFCERSQNCEKRQLALSCPSAWNWTDLIKFDIWDFFLNLSRKLKFH
jgi:hypothetical protein